jgi:hypothetical protein
VKRCFSCDIELPPDPPATGERNYCCSGCEAGGPCSCTYEGSPKHSTNGHTDPVVTLELLGLLPEGADGASQQFGEDK